MAISIPNPMHGERLRLDPAAHALPVSFVCAYSSFLYHSTLLYIAPSPALTCSHTTLDAEVTFMKHKVTYMHLFISRSFCKRYLSINMGRDASESFYLFVLTFSRTTTLPSP